MSTQHDGTWQPPTDEEARVDENDRERDEKAGDGTAEGTDPEALDHEREEYPDPESYPSPMEGEQQILDGTTPDADLQVDGEQT